MRDVKAVGDGRLDTWEAVRMNERSYWDQFFKNRACGGLSAVPESDTGKEMRSEPGEVDTRAARLLRPSVQRRRDRDGEQHAGSDQVLGIVLKAEPIGEYDRRVVILTREKGKISAFCKGERESRQALSGSYQSVYLRDVRAVCRAKFLQRL